MDWKIIPVHSNSSRLELEGSDNGSIYNYHVSVKFDGCIEFSQYYKYYNGFAWDHECKGDECRCSGQNIHICDVGAMITSLQKLNVIASKYFEWYE